MNTATADNRRCIKQLRSRFERWELSHLRELAASLHQQLEEAESRAYDAERRADMFYDMQLQMEAELRGFGPQLGITQRGELVLLPRTAPRVVCDDFGDLVEVAQ